MIVVIRSDLFFERIRWQDDAKRPMLRRLDEDLVDLSQIDCAVHRVTCSSLRPIFGLVAYM